MKYLANPIGKLQELKFLIEIQSESYKNKNLQYKS